MLKGNDLESKKYFLFDIDGTFAIDDTIITAARSCLIILKALADELFILRTIRSKAEKIILRNLRNGIFPQ